MNIEKLLRLALLEKQMKQNKAAALVDYTPNAFSALLRKNRIEVNHLEKIAAALGYELRVSLVDRTTGATIEA